MIVVGLETRREKGDAKRERQRPRKRTELKKGAGIF